MKYSVQPVNRIFVKRNGRLSFAKNMSKNKIVVKIKVKLKW